MLVAAVLEQAGFDVSTAGGGREGLALVESTEPVVTTLDLHMPGMDGIETARRIRAISPTYLVMLSGSTDEIDTLQGLEAGADDFIGKPFPPRELRARIEAMLRRPRAHAFSPPVTESRDDDEHWLEHRGLRLHPQMRVAVVDGRELDLTRSEFDILADLLSSGRRVRSKSQLALMLRGEHHASTTYVSDSDARAIEVHMANLRRKLGDTASHPRWVETVRGVGYRLTAAE